MRGKFYARLGCSEVDLLNEAVEGEQSLEVIEILISELKNKIEIQKYLTAFNLAVKKQDMDLCKLFCKENI